VQASFNNTIVTITDTDGNVVTWASAGKVGDAGVKYGGGAAIPGWGSPNKGAYSGLAGRLGKVGKKAIFAPPDPVRFDVKDVLITPATLDEFGRTGVRQHFEQPPERME